MRTLLLIAAIVLAFLIVRTLLIRARPRKPSPRPTQRIQSGDVVRCDHCGLHVPESESVRNGDRHYCCEDHRRRALDD
ncbi:MAG: PP0621 family protein [Chromatiales bacterium]|jgi:uncharacterized protein|nr:PP0621 family protein [Chromatiales bacterium]MDX9768251.1 PP0621 family protein [Ectothiorhodospiraceae bacterium]